MAVAVSVKMVASTVQWYKFQLEEKEKGRKRKSKRAENDSLNTVCFNQPF